MTTGNLVERLTLPKLLIIFKQKKKVWLFSDFLLLKFCKNSRIGK